MILTHDDLSAIEASFGPEKAAPIISALEKLESEQKAEVKKDLILELATKADLAEFKGALQMELAELRKDFVRLETELKGENRRLETELRGENRRLETELRGALQMESAELRKEFVRLETGLNTRITRLEMLMKVLIGLVIVAMSLFSPAGVELIKLLK